MGKISPVSAAEPDPSRLTEARGIPPGIFGSALGSASRGENVMIRGYSNPRTALAGALGWLLSLVAAIAIEL
jgi:hypothetical protein